MKPKLKRNLLIAPIAIPLRVVIMLPLLAVAKLGEFAEVALDYLWDKLPGLER